MLTRQEQEGLSISESGVRRARMGSKPTGQSRDSACAQQIDPLNPAIGQASDGDWPSIIRAGGRCGFAKAVEDSRGQKIFTLRFRH